MALLVDSSDDRTLLDDLCVADRFWRRLIGLQFRGRLKPNQGLWISPCNSIHTCFLRFPIDVVMLDREMHVLAVKKDVPPWRVFFCVKNTHSIVETSADSVQWTIGSRLEIVHE